MSGRVKSLKFPTMLEYLKKVWNSLKELLLVVNQYGRIFTNLEQVLINLDEG